MRTSTEKFRIPVSVGWPTILVKIEQRFFAHSDPDAPKAKIFFLISLFGLRCLIRHTQPACRNFVALTSH